MPSGEFYVGKTHDVTHFLQECRSKACNGYFHQKKNSGACKLLFKVDGDWTKELKAFGGRKFMLMIASYDPLDDAIHQLLA